MASTKVRVGFFSVPLDSMTEWQNIEWQNQFFFGLSHSGRILGVICSHVLKWQHLFVLKIIKKNSQMQQLVTTYS
jgi:hypothetical protein